MRKLILTLTCAAALSLPAPAASAGAAACVRLIALTDIDNEPDDQESLVRLLLYSDCIDIRGLVATTSTHLRHRVAQETIHAVIDAYAKVQANLRLHDPRYPEADSLRSRVACGLPRYGMNGVGRGKDSSGSRLIASELLRADDRRPLWICVWGGTSTLAQALFSLRDQKPDAELDRLIARLRVYAIADQDDTAAWLRREFPSLFYITSGPVYDGAHWTTMSAPAATADPALVSPEWIARNIQQGHGPLGAAYPDYAYTMEGDSTSFLGLIPNGLWRARASRLGRLGRTVHARWCQRETRLGKALSECPTSGRRGPTGQRRATAPSCSAGATTSSATSPHVWFGVQPHTTGPTTLRCP